MPWARRQQVKGIGQQGDGNDVVELRANTAGWLYSSDDIVDLTTVNFNHEVLEYDGVVFVIFCTSWNGHCRNLAPEWKKAASMLKGVVKVGSVDMDVHGVGGPYSVRGFPTIKIFGLNKQSPQDYNGARTQQGIVDVALKAVKDLVTSRQGGGRGNDQSGSNDGDDVIELTDANFEQKVLGTKDLALVNFFAPWCGHCQRLAPEWKLAAAELKGKVVVGALDATVHTVTASRFQVRGYPTIKYFPVGAKDGHALDYQGGRTASDIVAWALAKRAEQAPPPEIYELLGSAVQEDRKLKMYNLGMARTDKKQNSTTKI